MSVNSKTIYEWYGENCLSNLVSCVDLTESQTRLYFCAKIKKRYNKLTKEEFDLLDIAENYAVTGVSNRKLKKTRNLIRSTYPHLYYGDFYACFKQAVIPDFKYFLSCQYKEIVLCHIFRQLYHPFDVPKSYITTHILELARSVHSSLDHGTARILSDACLDSDVPEIVIQTIRGYVPCHINYGKGWHKAPEDFHSDWICELCKGTEWIMTDMPLLKGNWALNYLLKGNS